MSVNSSSSASLSSLVQSIKERRSKGPILYLIVIGFHHKKGCQIEHVYPNDFKALFKSSETADRQSPEDDGDLHALPRRWRHLPSLALPDGSHNYESDYVYFHLEDFDESDFGGGVGAPESTETELKAIKKVLPTIFGISCYRQIDASQLIAKDSEVTRNTLQKSVCVLAAQPLYGSVRGKLEAITLAYFNQKDFRKTDILDKAFVALAKTFEYASLSPYGRLGLPKALPGYLSRGETGENAAAAQPGSIYHVGFSVGDFVLRYQHKALTLFKLLLLQKKCLFQLSPVSHLSDTILTLVSLVPDVFGPLSADSGTAPSAHLAQSKSLEDLNENEAFSSPEQHLPGDSAAAASAVNYYQFCSGFFHTMDLIDSELERKGQIRSTAAKQSPRPLERRESRPVSLASLIPDNQALKNDDDDEHVHLDLAQPHHHHHHKSSEAGAGRRKKQELPKFASKKVAQDQIKRLKDLNDSRNSVEEETATNGSKSLPAPTLSFFKSKFSRISSILASPAPLPGLKQTQQSPVTMTTRATLSPPGGVEADSGTPARPVQAYLESASEAEEESSRTFQRELDEFLRTNFGMPLKLFSQFNVLHPYLSLYYMEHFSMVNKMSTTLFCTTFKLNNMTRYAKVDTDTAAVVSSDKIEEVSEPAVSADLWNDSLLTTGGDHSSSYRSPPNSNPVDVESKIGYTIGATNVLFKQRLQDKLDALVDEFEVDLTGNEELKKQLELTTADQRFMYFIIKNVSEYKSGGGEQQAGNSSSPVADTRVTKSSIRRSASVNIYDKFSYTGAHLAEDKSGDKAGVALSALSPVGSDDWVRSYFKWYLYSLLGSMLREDIHESFRTDLDVLLTANLDPHHHHPAALDSKDAISINESLASLDNSSMIDFNDVLNDRDQEQAAAKSVQPKSVSTASIDDAKPARKFKSKRTRKHTRDPASSSSLSSSAATAHPSSIVEYRDDFNKHFVDEFRKTACYREWSAHNKSRLGSSLFKLQSPVDQSISIDVLDPSSKSQALRLVTSDLASLEQSTIAHPFNTANGSYLNDMKVKMSFLFSSTESGKRINKALTESSKVLSGVFKTAFSPFMKQQQQQSSISAAEGETLAEASTKM